MKNLLSLLLSFQLILPHGVFATEPENGATNIPGTEETSAVNNDAYKKTGNGSSGGMDFYVSQIAGIGTGMLGASIITQCLEGLKTPSIATFMAGSLVHITSELLGAKKKNDRNKKKFSDLKLKQEELATKGDSSQLESLKAFLVEEEDTNEFLRNRKSWMIAVDIIYLAAVGLAIAEETYGLTIGNTTATSACTTTATTLATSACAAANIPAGAGVAAATAIGTAAPITLTVVPVVTAAAIAPSAATTASAAAVPFSAVLAAAIPPAIAGCTTAIIGGAVPLCVANFNALMLATKANAPTHSQARAVIKGYCNKDTSCIAAAEAELGVVYAACQEAPTDGGTSMFSWTGLLAMAYGFGSGQLNKDGGQVASYGSMAVSLLTAFVPGASAMVSKLYNFPIPRSITFGALAVMSGINTAGLAKREEISNDNIVKLKNAILQFKLETEGATALRVADADKDGDDNDSPRTKKINKMKDLVVNRVKNCISNSGGKYDVSEKACGKPLKLAKINFGKINIPALNNVANMANDMAQALAEGDEARAHAIAKDVGQNAARVKQAVAELKAKYNEDQKKRNKPGVDFNKKIAAQVASIQSSMNQAAASKGLNLASMSSGDPVSDDKSDKAAEGVPEVTVAAVPAAAMPETDPLAGMGGATEEMAIETPVTGKTEQSLDDFESTEQDVSKKSDVSIFKQLSNRYILNWNKMFERQKPEVVQEEPKKN